MKQPFDALMALNGRKVAAFGDAEDLDGQVVATEAWRPILIGLDLDIAELEYLGMQAISNCLGTLAVNEEGLGLLEAASAEQIRALGYVLKSLAIDAFTAGVLFDRDRRP